jgi:hypothetical protein
VGQLASAAWCSLADTRAGHAFNRFIDVLECLARLESAPFVALTALCVRGDGKT